jgi:hypothetical protein
VSKRTYLTIWKVKCVFAAKCVEIYSINKLFKNQEIENFDQSDKNLISQCRLTATYLKKIITGKRVMWLAASAPSEEGELVFYLYIFLEDWLA